MIIKGLVALGLLMFIMMLLQSVLIDAQVKYDKRYRQVGTYGLKYKVVAIIMLFFYCMIPIVNILVVYVSIVYKDELVERIIERQVREGILEEVHDE